LARRLRLSNAEIDRLAGLLDGGALPTPETTPAAARAAIYRDGGGRYLDRLLLAAARQPQPQRFAPLLAAGRDFTAPKLPGAGRDLVALGVPKGPAVGKLLRAVEEEWIAGDFNASRVQLLAWAKVRR